MHYAPIARFILPRTKWIIWLCAIFSLSAPILRIVPLNGLEDVQWALELISHWQWVYLVAGITCLYASGQPILNLGSGLSKIVCT